MKKQSIWLKDFKNNVTILNKDIDCDVLIIGAGITGLSTAYHLINSNLKVVVVEKDEIGNDVTARTTGKITYLQELIYIKLKISVVACLETTSATLPGKRGRRSLKIVRFQRVSPSGDPVCRSSGDSVHGSPHRRRCGGL